MFKKEWLRNWIVISLFFTGCVQASPKIKEPIAIAVIDSGLDLSTAKSVKLCGKGYNFITLKEEIGYDYLGHGSHIASTIADFAKSNYCLNIYKIFDDREGGSPVNIGGAIRLAIKDGAKVINLSLNGKSPSSFERTSIREATALGIKVFVAAGNNRFDLDKKCQAFPACYKASGATVVGSLYHKNSVANYGSIVKQKELYCYKGMCGTSVSTAIATGKYVKSLNK